MIQFGDPRLPTRFWSKVRIDGDSGCWIWTGELMGSRRIYGRFQMGGRSGKARSPHRWVFLVEGEIPDGMHVDHLCRVPLCCNPEHLEIVTPQENVRRQFAVKTHCKHGHEFTPENTYTKANGNRSCRECGRIRGRLQHRSNLRPEHRPVANGLLNAFQLQAAKTECVNGHAYTPENTYRKPNGNRDCRSCIRQRTRDYSTKKQAMAS